MATVGVKGLMVVIHGNSGRHRADSIDERHDAGDRRWNEHSGVDAKPREVQSYLLSEILPTVQHNTPISIGPTLPSAFLYNIASHSI